MYDFDFRPLLYLVFGAGAAAALVVMGILWAVGIL